MNRLKFNRPRQTPNDRHSIVYHDLGSMAANFSNSTAMASLGMASLGSGMASLGSDLVFGFQQVLFDLIILFFEGLGILDHFLGFLDQVGGTVWVTEPKAL